MKGCDAQGYPLEGVDVVPERKPEWKPGWKLLYSKEEDFHAGKIQYCVQRLTELLQEVNKRNDDMKDKYDKLKDEYSALHRKYTNLHTDNVALKYSDLCSECQNAKDSTRSSGKTYTLCESCAEGSQTIESLKLGLKKVREEKEKEKEKRYWQECYETALKQLAENDG